MDSKAGYPGLPPSGANEALPPYAPAATAPPYGQPYGGQPPVAGYSAQPGYVAPQYPMSGGPPQQPQVVMVGPGPQPQQTNIQLAQSFVAHIVFACVVFWCCNWLFGLIAFILASQYNSLHKSVYKPVTSADCSFLVMFGKSKRFNKKRLTAVVVVH